MYYSFDRSLNFQCRNKGRVCEVERLPRQRIQRVESIQIIVAIPLHTSMMGSVMTSGMNSESVRGSRNKGIGSYLFN